MKTKWLFSLVFTLLSAARLAAAENPDLIILSPNGGTYAVGTTLDIAWQHAAAHTGKTDLIRITIFSRARAEPEPLPAYQMIVTNAYVQVGTETPSTGTWPWTIPEDFPHGAYLLEVVELQEGNLATLAADRSEVFIGPKPKFAFIERPREMPIAAGSFPRFAFAFEGLNLQNIQPFLKKDGVVLGILPGDVRYHGEAGIFTWELTRYQTTTQAPIANAGTNYTVFIGFSKTPDAAQSFPDISLDTLAAYDETAPFEIAGTPRPLIINYVPERDSMPIYVVGKPTAEYVIYWSEQVPAFWETIWQKETDTDGVLRGFIGNRSKARIGFFRAERANLAPLGWEVRIQEGAPTITENDPEPEREGFFRVNQRLFTKPHNVK